MRTVPSDNDVCLLFLINLWLGCHVVTDKFGGTTAAKSRDKGRCNNCTFYSGHQCSFVFVSWFCCPLSRTQHLKRTIYVLWAMFEN